MRVAARAALTCRCSRRTSHAHMPAAAARRRRPMLALRISGCIELRRLEAPAPPSPAPALLPSRAAAAAPLPTLGSLQAGAGSKQWLSGADRAARWHERVTCIIVATSNWQPAPAWPQLPHDLAHARAAARRSARSASHSCSCRARPGGMQWPTHQERRDSLPFATPPTRRTTLESCGRPGRSRAVLPHAASLPV